ncbi:3-methyl-2-oxobutanoate dehydrogenase subunit beta [Austwickia sp. TVS 96-490-7B]|uniref:alpha-ketoacid dehydrogenase subunit beta n=1 Tax=Austwickia sp. TVS 96-490-7B TaxID=2830843 RepID=UPI001C59B02C|nr:alpha-ketoacid dehydrogenase subunit beta [Austwickia sp. TVS 96-490-7B]MBW3085155.1 3-methyl-2-oxobutanoate dehydrogenase subunit beta [Austwickia sp. TVS 96-490-7B]
MTKLTLAKGITAGLRRAMAADPKVLVMGEDVGRLGGVFRVTEGLQREFGESRVIDTPLAESGIVGTAIGLAMRGYRPVVEIQFDGFVYPAFDHITSQVAKMRNRSQGHIELPMVIRMPCGGGIGAVEHHSESNEAYFLHSAGLRVVACSHAEDSYWMIQQAIASNDPVVFFEPKRRYHDKMEVDETATAAPYGLYDARVLRQGSHATLACFGPMVKTCLAAADAAADEGQDLEVIDLRGLNPLDYSTLEASVAKTGRLVVVHEASRFMGVGAEISAHITERLFYHLESPVIRVTGYSIPYPASKLEEFHLPDLDRVLDGVDRALAY